MAWQPGQSGNPSGRPRDKPLTDALRMELANPSPKPPPRGTARRLAYEAISRAQMRDASGNAAYNAICDRLEGKLVVPQTYGQDPNLGPIQFIVTGVPRLEDKASNAIDITPDKTALPVVVDAEQTDTE